MDLGGITIPNKTTDKLLDGYKRGTNSASENRYLETLYYQFGRYLLISSSREGSLPANLQGIWAEGLTPPWDADYHTNINVQMNYWPAQQTNLAECHQPVIDYTNSLVARGREVAKKYHMTEDGRNVRGWVTYHENNVWGNTAPAVSDAFYFPAGAAWLCQDIWEQYAFTLDKDKLAANYNTMKDAALFWVDNLVKDPRDGLLVASPSWSPEHGPVSIGTSADQTIIWELFNNTIKAAKVLEDTSSEINEIVEAQKNLALPKIGVNGQYMEWRDEITLDVTGDNEHRHVNHLYALHPGSLVVANRSEEDNKALEAMKVTLNTRGDGGTGWSIAWKINFWARLREGERAGVLVNNILKQGTFGNLYDVCPPFQIDGNFGATAGITEMFLQSQGDSIDLLPALPSAWNGSSISGLKARGNIEVDIKVDVNGNVEKAILKPGTDNDSLLIRGAGLSRYKVKTLSGSLVDAEVVD
jgi:alpha-L-fucosidase 2